MRDFKLTVFTLRAIRILGDGAARIVQTNGTGGWYAGPQPLNSQAVWDLVGDGWLKMVDGGKAVSLDAWPRFAGDDPNLQPDGVAP